MPVRSRHDQENNSIFFVTFSCFNWIPLIEITNSYDLIYRWFDYLVTQNIHPAGFVIMPNHVHVLLYFAEMAKPINTVIGNGKRFIAYDIIKRLKEGGQTEILSILVNSVSVRESKKGQLHKIFNESFDAKICYSKDFIFQKLNYIHTNPTRGKWSLVDDYTTYKHSSAGFYERGEIGYPKLLHIGEII